MSAHTKGPWRHAGKTKGTGAIHSSADGEVLVATVGAFRDRELLPFNVDRWRADCDLIAAAPTLLAALKDCEATFATWIDAVNGHGATDEELASMTNAVWANCKVAIAKAEGRS